VRAGGAVQAVAATGAGRAAGLHSLAAAAWPAGHRKASRRDPPAMICLLAAAFRGTPRKKDKRIPRAGPSRRHQRCNITASQSRDRSLRPMLGKALRLLCAVAWMTAAAGPTHAHDKIRVVASFSILADLARNVAGDAADVSALVGPDSDAHAYAPSPA